MSANIDFFLRIKIAPKNKNVYVSKIKTAKMAIPKMLTHAKLEKLVQKMLT